MLQNFLFLSSADKGPNQVNPLEQFLILSKSAKGAAATQLIQQVLEASGLYVFSELLDCPNIAAVCKVYPILY